MGFGQMKFFLNGKRLPKFSMTSIGDILLKEKKITVKDTNNSSVGELEFSDSYETTIIPKKLRGDEFYIQGECIEYHWGPCSSDSEFPWEYVRDT